MRRATLERAQLRKFLTDGDVGAEAVDRFRVVLSEGHDDLGLDVITIPVVVPAGLLGPLAMADGAVVLSLPAWMLRMLWLTVEDGGPAAQFRAPAARRSRTCAAPA